LVRLRVNGVPRTLDIEPWVSLLDLLRDRLNLTGTKKGCDHGQCGACTVLIDGQRMLSCLTLGVMRDGCEITTVEGLARLHATEGRAAGGPAGVVELASDDADDVRTGSVADSPVGTVPGTAPAPQAAVQAQALHPLQKAFIQHDAFQCGYCTPGQLCSAVGLIREGEAQTVDEVRELMSGNLCRCGAYPQITAAVCQVALGLQGDAAASRTAHEPVVTGTVPA
jgi:xanthine dehydrogenase YagT iron-sulfur-binding subunit